MEIWKDIIGFEGYYQVSDMGLVKSLDRVIKHSQGGDRNKKGALMKQKTTDKGATIYIMGEINTEYGLNKL